MASDFDAARRDLGAFAEMVGQPLRPFQLASLRLDTRVTALLGPRQGGKSRSLALLAVWHAATRAAQGVLIVSSSELTARLLLDKVRAIVVSSPMLAGSVLDEQAMLVRLSNGSSIRAVAASERSVRGHSVDLLLVDEAQSVEADVLLSAALPTTAARPDARIVLSGTASSAGGPFFDHCVLGERGSDYVRTHRWLLEDCDWLTPTAIEQARESMSSTRFAAEYLCQWQSESDALFTRELLARVTRDYLPPALADLHGPARVTMGVDYGERHDRSALVAIGSLVDPAGGRGLAVVCTRRWDSGAPIPDVIREIAASPAHVDVLASERNGIGGAATQYLFEALRKRPTHHGGGRPSTSVYQGQALMDLLDGIAMDRRPFPGEVRAPQGFTTKKIAVHTDAAMKSATYAALRLLFERGLLVLPAAAEDLLRELLLLRVDLTASGSERIEASHGHDDMPDSLALSMCPYRDRNGRWRTVVGDAAQRLAAAGDGRLGAVERRPVIGSVRGDRVTLPAGVVAGPDGGSPAPWLQDARAAVARGLQSRHEEVQV